ncbi:MAG TPA: CotH kinase family protein [Polyangiaceae bacterium]|nr:CotH kinase family protein [Polyangiaceae bacterium]
MTFPSEAMPLTRGMGSGLGLSLGGAGVFRLTGKLSPCSATRSGHVVLAALLALGCDPGSVASLDSPGSTSTECEADGTLSERDADELFYADHVPSFDLYLPEEKWAALQQNAVDEQWEEAEACFDGKLIGPVNMRFKGSYGTLFNCFDDAGNMLCPRLSMKLKFDRDDEDARFFGLKRLNLHANRYDDSRMKERLAYDLYRSMGITAPRASWAVVRVNGKSYGLYGMVEELDGRFTADRWPEHPDGNLYKEVWPTETDPSAIAAALKTNEEDGDISGFLEFSQAINAAGSTEEVRDVLGTYTDLDYWARYMAVDDAILSYDGVTYFYTDDGSWSRNHNYYFYEDAPGHFALVPWDVESTFWINPDHAPPNWTVVPEDCSQTYPYWEGLATAPGCNAVFRALASDLEPWRDAVRELLEGPFALDTMNEAIDQHEALIREAAQSTDTPTMYGPFAGAVANTRTTVSALRDRLLEQLAEEP